MITGDHRDHSQNSNRLIDFRQTHWLTHWLTTAHVTTGHSTTGQTITCQRRDWLQYGMWTTNRCQWDKQILLQMCWDTNHSLACADACTAHFTIYLQKLNWTHECTKLNMWSLVSKRTWIFPSVRRLLSALSMRIFLTEDSLQKMFRAWTKPRWKHLFVQLYRMPEVTNVKIWSRVYTRANFAEFRFNFHENCWFFKTIFCKKKLRSQRCKSVDIL